MEDNLLQKLSTIPDVEPDEFDLAMIRLAEAENDESLVSLEDFEKSIDGYSGEILI